MAPASKPPTGSGGADGATLTGLEGLSWASFAAGLEADEPHVRAALTASIRDCGHPAVRWETAPVSRPKYYHHAPFRTWP